MTGHQTDPPAITRDVPNAARMYDYYLGGSHNFAADRPAADRAVAAMPWLPGAARANRSFLGRAVRFCQAAGIGQFLDLGSGIPTAGNVHEIARASDRNARVAYVDNEPVTVATCTAMLETDPLTTISAVDVRDVDAVFAAPGVRDLLDLSRPVALLTVAVLHFVPDDDDPVALAAAYRARLAPGSVHVLSHATGDHDPDGAPGGIAAYRNTANPITPRSRERVAELLAGTALVDPGLVDATGWRPGEPIEGERPGSWAAVGRIH